MNSKRITKILSNTLGNALDNAFSYKRLILSLSLIIIDVLFFNFTNPTSIISIGLFFGFILLLLTLYMLVDSLILLFGKYVKTIKYNKKKIEVLIVGLGSILLALKSIGQLNIVTFVAFIFLGILILGYSHLIFKKL